MHKVTISGAFSLFQVETRGCCILMLDLARQMGQHDTGYIPDQATLNLHYQMRKISIFWVYRHFFENLGFDFEKP